MLTEKLDKNNQIANSVKTTKLRRASQICKVYTVKIQDDALNKDQKEYLARVFREAKWWYNWVLSVCKDEPDKFDIFHFWTGHNEIEHLDKDSNVVQVNLTLPSLFKQAITDQMISNIRTLAKLKQLGYQKPGMLKFKSEIRSINLKQLNSTHRIFGNKIKLVGCKKPFKVNGLDQLSEGVEFANAKLLNRPDGYYIALTTYQDKGKIQPKESNGQTIGIDMGCQTSFTLSNGEKINCTVRETERIKRLSRKMNRRQQKGSNNWNKTRHLLQIEYQKLSNRKNDLANKLIAKLAQYETVIIQDEQLQNWAKLSHGKAVQHSVLGRVKAKLLQMDNCVVLSRWLPTTKLCTNCGARLDLSQWDRQFNCDCGITEDRDVHAAQNLIWFYKHNIGVGRTEFKPAEILEMISRALCKTDFNRVSMKQEDSCL